MQFEEDNIFIFYFSRLTWKEFNQDSAQLGYDQETRIP